MGQTVETYRFSVDEFVRAWEAGAFDRRVELIEGELWPVVIGDWHGKTVGRVMRQIFAGTVEVTTSTLPSGNSLPDPDCWVLREGAEPVGRLGARLSRWSPDDVLLVVEVSDETLLADLNLKARIYAGAGWPEYWVVTQEEVFVHTRPSEGGYLSRTTYRRGMRVPLSYASAEIGVDDLIGPQT